MQASPFALPPMEGWKVQTPEPPSMLPDSASVGVPLG